MKTLVMTTLILSLLAAAAAAQPPVPTLEMFSSWTPRADLDLPAGDPAHGAEVGVASAGFEAKWPTVYRQGALVIEHSLGGRVLELDWGGRPAGAGGVERVYALSYGLSVMKPLNETWRGMLMLQPTLTTDFADGSEVEALNFTGAALALRPSGQRTMLGFGLAYSLRFGQAFPIPLFMMQWRGAGRWSADLLLPAHAELDYALSRTLSLGLRMQADGGQYHVAGLESAAALDDPQLRIIDATLGPVLRWSPTPKLSAALSAGFSLHRELGYYDGNDEHLMLDPEAGPSLGLTITATR